MPGNSWKEVKAKLREEKRAKHAPVEEKKVKKSKKDEEE